MSTNTCTIDYFIYDRETEEFGVNIVIKSGDNTYEYFIENPNDVNKLEWQEFYNNAMNFLTARLEFKQSTGNLVITSENGILTFEIFGSSNVRISHASISASCISKLLEILINRIGCLRL